MSTIQYNTTEITINHKDIYLWFKRFTVVLIIIIACRCRYTQRQLHYEYPPRLSVSGEHLLPLCCNL